MTWIVMKKINCICSKNLSSVFIYKDEIHFITHKKIKHKYPELTLRALSSLFRFFPSEQLDNHLQNLQ